MRQERAEVDRHAMGAEQHLQLTADVVRDQPVGVPVDHDDATDAAGHDVLGAVDHGALRVDRGLALEGAAHLLLDVGACVRGERVRGREGPRALVGLDDVGRALDIDPLVEQRSTALPLGLRREREAGGVAAHADAVDDVVGLRGYGP